MTKGEKWKRLFETKGWINENVVRGNEKFSLNIIIAGSCDSPDRGSVCTDSALIMPELDLLCFEDRQGSVFFDWEDILQVRMVPASKRKGWL